tara:strand:+ start:97 stop:486 length:390 start_codon:yes stop_codon:yes gene_type:complete
MQPRDVMIKWLADNIPALLIEPEDRSLFDVVGVVNGNGARAIYSLEVNERWTGDWPDNWKSVYIPTKNKKLLTEWKKLYKDDLYTFVIFRKDLKKAWHVAADIVAASKISGENYIISIRDTYQVDMIND